jgi:hypothetical protein
MGGENAIHFYSLHGTGTLEFIYHENEGDAHMVSLAASGVYGWHAALSRHASQTSEDAIGPMLLMLEQSNFLGDCVELINAAQANRVGVA